MATNDNDDNVKKAQFNAEALLKAEAEVKAAEEASRKVEEEALLAEKQAAEDAAKAAASASKSSSQRDDEMLAKLVQERVAEQLKGMKENIDKAYKARDELLAKNAEYERKEREATIKRLEEEGKHKEVFEMQKAELQARLEAAEKRNTELSRDVAVRNALSVLPFRNTTASDMAYREVVAQLIQNDKGEWIHRSGISIPTFIEAFAKQDDMSFLLRPKASSGAGTSSSSSTTSQGTGQPKSLFKLSQAEVIKMAEEGKLPARAR
jgi:hypothetical protein